MKESHQQAVVFSLAGLGARDLGAYGNTWIETPGLDRFASRAFLFESAVASEPLQGAETENMLRGRPSWQATPEDQEALFPELSAAGLTRVLFTDRPEDQRGKLATDFFDEVVAVQDSRSASSATALDQTHCAGFFAQLLDCCESLPPRHLLWVDYHGLLHAWDAPLAVREKLELDEAVALPEFVRPPESRGEAWDDDQLLQAQWAWAAEIHVLDRCLDAVVEEFQKQRGLIVLTSPHGYPLGEHGLVGVGSPLVYSEASSVPLIFADGSLDISWRSQSLTATTVVQQLLQQFLIEGIAVDQMQRPPTNAAAIPSVAFLRAKNQIGVRTEQWLLIDSPDRSELYAKPDDRWEANDVATRCSDVVDQLRSLATAAQLRSIA